MKVEWFEEAYDWKKPEDLYKVCIKQQKEIKRLQEDFTYMAKKAYDFYSALLDIKHYIDNEWGWDGTGIDDIEIIVEEALEKDTITKEDIKKLRGE